ncbi:hypothetical protein D3C87_782600 [compost metagenome]
MEEKLSTIERQWKADEERRAGPSIAGLMDHQRQRAATEPQRRFEAAARALPDALFADDEEIQHLAREAEAMKQRAENEGRMRLAGGGLDQAVASIHGELQQAQQAMKWAAVDDAIAGAFDFPRSAALTQRIADLRRRLEAAALAREAFALKSGDWTALGGDLQRARNALFEALIAKKREHLRSHPELLEAPAADRADQEIAAHE